MLPTTHDLLGEPETINRPMTNWYTSRWASLTKTGRWVFVLLHLSTLVNIIDFIINPKLDSALLAVAICVITIGHADVHYWRSQARAWCGMNHLARNLSRALDTGSDILITTNSNGEDDLIVIDRKGTTP